MVRAPALQAGCQGFDSPQLHQPPQEVARRSLAEASGGGLFTHDLLATVGKPTIYTIHMPKAVMLWSGGKDSALALYRCTQRGYSIKSLVTFGPWKAKFQAHPIPMIKLQASSLGLPHHMIEIEEPFRESYIKQFKIMKSEGVEAVITGDIDYVDGYPSLIQQCCEEVGLQCVLPLWQENRDVLMHEILDANFHIVMTYLSHPSLDQSWRGRRITREAIQELRRLPIDLCGENGEYHTMTLNMPLFHKEIEMIAE